MSPTLAGRFLSTGPPGKSNKVDLTKKSPGEDEQSGKAVSRVQARPQALVVDAPMRQMARGDVTAWAAVSPFTVFKSINSLAQLYS